MPFSTRRLLATFCVAALAATACQDQPTVPDAAAPSALGDAQPAPSDRQPSGIEARFLEMAREIPGFGGYYYDEDDNLVAYVTDLGRADQVRSTLQPVLQRRLAQLGDHVRPGAQVVVRRADYDFEQLWEWRQRLLEPVMDTEGVVFMHIAEDRNQLVVGMLPEGEAVTRKTIAALSSSLEVPDEAIQIETTSRITEDAQNLQQRVRPVKGGLQIQFERGGFYIPCTMTISVRRLGARHIMTNSHCTRNEGDLLNTPYWQAWHWDTNAFIGTESVDPHWWTCGPFYARRLCRNSDAALARLEDAVDDRFGFIARTEYRRLGWGINGSLKIDQNNPHFEIHAEDDPPVGEYVNQVGRTTGWTWGKVTGTGVTINYRDEETDQRRRLYDQATAEYYAFKGDSGAPVFRINFDETLLLYGVHWGSSQEGEYSAFSPMSQVRKDIAYLRTHGDPETSDPGGGGGDDCEPEPDQLICDP